MRAALVAQLLVTATGLAYAQGQPTSAAPAVKIGYVNTAALMDAAPGKRAADSAYQKEVDAFQAQQKRWGDSLQTLATKLQKESATLTPAQKDAHQKAFNDLQAEFDQKNQAGIQRMQNRQNELVAPLMEIVKKAIDDIRVEDGYAMIFSGDANSPIISADKNLDVTDRVVSRLKTIAAKAPTPSSMAPAALTKKPPTQ
jgi:outer membrane protein